MLKDPKNIVESIIALSKEPVDDLSLLMENINEHIKFYENTSFIVKPFIKKDMTTIMNIEENELFDLLSRIKNNLEKIEIAASSIKNINRFMDIHTDMESRDSEIPQVYEEKKYEKNIIYCPECGNKCNDKNGLKIHVYMVHKENRDEILKTIELYDR